VATRLKREAKTLAPEAYRALLAHEWKGNVRELEHALEQAVVLASNETIGVDDLPPAVRGTGAPAAAPGGDGPATFKEAKQQLIERFERQFIAEALTRSEGNISKAADEMGMYRQHLQLKLAEYGIDADTFRRRER
jgi:DNA-binding NtrC family response regulator